MTQKRKLKAGLAGDALPSPELSAFISEAVGQLGDPEGYTATYHCSHNGPDRLACPACTEEMKAADVAAAKKREEETLARASRPPELVPLAPSAGREPTRDELADQLRRRRERTEEALRTCRLTLQARVSDRNVTIRRLQIELGHLNKLVTQIDALQRRITALEQMMLTQI